MSYQSLENAFCTNLWYEKISILGFGSVGAAVAARLSASPLADFPPATRLRIESKGEFLWIRKPLASLERRFEIACSDDVRFILIDANDREAWRQAETFACCAQSSGPWTATALILAAANLDQATELWATAGMFGISRIAVPCSGAEQQDREALLYGAAEGLFTALYSRTQNLGHGEASWLLGARREAENKSDSMGIGVAECPPVPDRYLPPFSPLMKAFAWRIASLHLSRIKDPEEEGWRLATIVPLNGWSMLDLVDDQALQYGGLPGPKREVPNIYMPDKSDQGLRVCHLATLGLLMPRERAQVEPPQSCGEA